MSLQVSNETGVRAAIALPKIYEIGWTVWDVWVVKKGCCSGGVPLSFRQAFLKG